MGLDRALAAAKLRCDGFDGQLMDVVKQEDLSAHGRQVGNGSLEVFSELLTLKVSTWTRGGLDDVAFVYEM